MTHPLGSQMTIAEFELFLIPAIVIRMLIAPACASLPHERHSRMRVTPA
jgi:hypothetical protein